LHLKPKFTVLSIFAILFFGIFSFVVLPVIPEASAAHNSNLIVSAENLAFFNTFAGPMVIEVVIDDPNISATDEPQGEPNVTVNGKDLRMVQGIDGKWYGYFADKTQALFADATQPVLSPHGLQFGVGCDPSSAGTIASF